MKPYRITLHCSATLNGVPVDASVIEKWHLERGFSTIGYHMVIEPEGEVQYGRPLTMQGAHVQGDNEGNIGICLIGNDAFTRVQFHSLRYKLNALKLNFDIPPWQIYCHNQFPSAQRQGKTCPGFSINAFLGWYYTDDWSSLAPFLLE